MLGGGAIGGGGEEEASACRGCVHDRRVVARSRTQLLVIIPSLCVKTSLRSA